MKISNERTIQELQTEFNQAFPFLRLTFYKTAHGFGQASSEADQLDATLTIGAINSLSGIGYLSLQPNQKVGDFERLFTEKFGLHAQVFRKSYGKWVQTWATDIWTLEEQNNRGRIMGDRRA